MARLASDIISRACDYPYSFPKTSFLFDAAKPDILAKFDKSETKHRTPVLAFGSNQSPIRLAQKFGHEAHHIIPVERVFLENFDVVYSAHITSYGALPAMLQFCPGTRMEAAITWLDDAQLDMMHQSEIAAANYHFAALENVELTHFDNKISQTVYLYVSAHGQLLKEGAGVSLSAIECRGRTGQSMTTAEALSYIHNQFSKGQSFEDFIVKMIEDKGFRNAIIAELSHSTLPFGHDYRIIK